MFFEDRSDAGKRLAETIARQSINLSGYSIVGIARGGVPVAEQITERLTLPLTAICVEERKLADGEKIVFTTSLAMDSFIFSKGRLVELSQTALPASSASQVEELIRTTYEKGVFYNNGEARIGAEVMVCDDGLASGKTVVVASHALRKAGAKKVILAVPIMPPWALRDDSFVRASFEQIIYWRQTTLTNPSVGIFYWKFEDTPDEFVVNSIWRNRQKVNYAP